MIARTALLRSPAVAVATTLALALSIAYATGTVRLDPSGLDFASQVGSAGVDLAWDDGLFVVLVVADTTPIGNLDLPGYAAGALPTDALGRITPYEAVTRLGFITTYPGGVSFVQQGTNVDAVMRGYAERLTELGFTVVHEAGASALSVHRDGHELRAVFGADEAGVMVYLGR
jgi:hypothetical protein